MMRVVLAPAVLGSIAGALPFSFLTLLPTILNIPALVPPDVAVLSIGFLPVGLAIALLSRQFLGITRFLRRGLIAAAVWLSLLSLCAVALDTLRYGIGSQHASIAVVLGSTLTAGALFAGLVPPLQATLRRALERRCFPDHYDPATTLRQFGAALVGLPGGSPEALANRILPQLATTLDLTWSLLALQDGDTPAHIWTHGALPAHLAPTVLVATDCPAAGMLRYAERERAYVVPLVVDGACCGALALGPKRHDIDLLPRDAALVATFAPLLATTLQNALRAEQLTRQLGTLAEREGMLAALSARLLHAQEEERRRIALELHDDPLQRVTLLARRLDDEAARLALDEIGGALRAICIGLRPPILDDLGLAAALEWLAADMRAQADREMVITVHVGPGVGGSLSDAALDLALFRVAQEALHNVLKHAQARAVTIALTGTEDGLALRVTDDGRGCGARGGPAASGATTPSLGLAGMRERLRPWGGAVTMAAGQGGGTVVTAVVATGDRHG